MSFRKYGGIDYSAKNNIIKNNYTTTNNLIVTDESNLQNSSTTSGPSGPNGVTGPTGLQGIPGLPGVTGLPYLPGVTGPTGLPGVTGPTGLTGLHGLPGVTGPHGIPGVTGHQGVTGPHGVTGPPGTSNSGNSTNYWGQTGSNIYYTNGGVGIGTNNPQALLDINNNNWSLNSSLPSTITNIAMSSSGQYQTVIGGANYYVSNNYGNTWSQAQSITNIINITSISVSTSGQYQLITGNDGTGNQQNIYVYLSSNYGQTFSMISSLQNIVSNNIMSSQISSNGQTIVVASNYIIYISNNGGISFISITFSLNQYIYSVIGIAMSQDPSGNYITFLISQFGIYYTQNGANTWSLFSNSNNWISVAMSSNGEIQVASETTQNYVWISTNYGSNWAQMTGTNAYYITSLNISSDGNTITGASNGGYIWQGVNTNGTWIWTEINSTSQGWISLGISSTLIYQTAISYQTGLYTSNNIALNVTGISQFNGNLTISTPLSQIAISPSYIQFPDGSQQVVAPGQQIVSSNTSLNSIGISPTIIQNISPLPIGVWLLEGQIHIDLSANPSNFWLRLGFSYSSTTFNSSGNYIQDCSVVSGGNTYARITGVINQTTNSTIYLLSQYGQSSSVTVTTNSAQLTYTRIA